MEKKSLLQMLKFTLFSISEGIIQVVSFKVFSDSCCYDEAFWILCRIHPGFHLAGPRGRRRWRERLSDSCGDNVVKLRFRVFIL